MSTSTLEVFETDLQSEAAEPCEAHPDREATFAVRHPGCLIFICDPCREELRKFMNNAQLLDLLGTHKLYCRKCGGREIVFAEFTITPIKQ